MNVGQTTEPCDSVTRGLIQYLMLDISAKTWGSIDSFVDSVGPSRFSKSNCCLHIHNERASQEIRHDPVRRLSNDRCQWTA